MGPGSEFVTASDRGFQIANCEFINAFEIRLHIYPQFVIRHLESISSRALSRLLPRGPDLPPKSTSRTEPSRMTCRVMPFSRDSRPGTGTSEEVGDRGDDSAWIVRSRDRPPGLGCGPHTSRRSGSLTVLTAERSAQRADDARTSVHFQKVGVAWKKAFVDVYTGTGTPNHGEKAGLTWRKRLAEPIVRPPSLAATEAKLRPDEIVIGVDVGGHARAYRLASFESKSGHLVNDLLDGTPVSELPIATSPGAFGSTQQPSRLRSAGPERRRPSP